VLQACWDNNNRRGEIPEKLLRSFSGTSFSPSQQYDMIHNSHIYKIGEHTMASIQESLEILKRGTVNIFSEEELKDRLSEKRPLRVKFGADPTAPDIHLGHTVVINKLKQFQDLGHQVLFLIGDFTGMIGDPTDKSVTRKPLTREQIEENAKTYQEQIFKILDPENTQIMFNSAWMDKLSAADMIKLASNYTVARMLERDDFNKRYTAGRPIAIHEFLYPLIQGYDSVAIKADVELGGTDQTFNMLVGRELQKLYDQKPQIVMTMPLIEGLDGVKKMSKSLGNYVGINEPPDEMFGKMMSISDTLMWRYLELLSFRSLSEIQAFRKAVNEGQNPKDIKILLAEEIVERFHGSESAKKARQNFIDQFSKGLMPEDIPTFDLSSEGNSLPLTHLLKNTGLVPSTSKAIRLIQQGAVRIDGERVEDPNLQISAGEKHIYQVGKRRFAKVYLI
jgi:tyrosyl-tRNA synthetase